MAPFGIAVPIPSSFALAARATFQFARPRSLRSQATSGRRLAVNCSRYSALIQAIPVAALVSASVLLAPVANAETAPEVLAVQVRAQGHVCGKALQATREPKLSKRDYDVWVLKCDNASYRLGRYPDLPANIEKLSDDEAAGRKK